MKKTLALMLALASLCTAFAACSGGDSGNSVTSAEDSASENTADSSSESTAEADFYPDIEGVDLDGADFGMVYFSNLLNHNWLGIPTDMNPTEETGDILNDAVYSRNRDVEDMINIVINEYPTGGGQKGFNTALSQAVMAGEDVYDLGFQSIVGIIGLADGGLLRDINTIGVNTDAPWYDQKSVEEMTVAGRLFYANCDISFYDKLATIVTFFNKDIAEDYNMDDFYLKVADGEWTYDYMLKCAGQISSDVNGDGVMNMDDVYGILCQNDGSYYLLHSSGLKVSERQGDELRLAINDERFVTTLQEIFDLMSSELYLNTQKFGANLNTAIKLFIENRNLFMIRPIQSAFSMRDMEADFGIIPMPRFFEDDPDYHTPTNIYPGTIMCVPKNSKNEDYIGLVLDLLAAESHDKVMPVLYDVVLDSKLSRDDITAEMLDIVFENRMYDFGLIWDIGGLRTKIVTPAHLNVASELASITEKAEIELEELYDALSLVD